MQNSALFDFVELRKNNRERGSPEESVYWGVVGVAIRICMPWQTKVRGYMCTQGGKAFSFLFFLPPSFLFFLSLFLYWGLNSEPTYQLPKVRIFKGKMRKAA
jgi:hypothetical protein